MKSNQTDSGYAFVRQFCKSDQATKGGNMRVADSNTLRNFLICYYKVERFDGNLKPPVSGSRKVTSLNLVRSVSRSRCNSNPILLTQETAHRKNSTYSKRQSFIGRRWPSG